MSSAPPSAVRAVVLVVALWAAGLGAAAQFAKIAVVLPELGALYPGRGAALGFLLTSISLLGVVLGLFAGWLGGLVGLRRLLLAALGVGAVLSAFQALLPSFSVMMLSRVLEGLSHLGIVVTAPTLIGTLTPVAVRGMAMTLWGTFFGVAFAITAWLGVPLAHGSGIPALFLAHAAVMVLTAIVLWRLLPRDAERAMTVPALDLASIVARHRAAYASARIVAPALGWLFYTATFVALVTILPTRVPGDARAWVAGAMPVASIMVSMTLGIALLRVMPAVGVVCAGFATAIPAAFGLLVWPGSIWVPVALAGALGLIQGASFAAIPQLNPRPADQALANGAVAQMGNTGNLIGTPLLLGAIAFGDMGAVVALVILAYALGLASHALAARARRRETTTSGAASRIEA